MQTNPITAEIHEIRGQIDHGSPVALADPNLARIIRLRLVSDPGFPMWDVSYCYGQMRDGTYVRVQLPRHQFPKAGLSRALVQMCRDLGIYARGIEILDNISLCS